MEVGNLASISSVTSVSVFGMIGYLIDRWIGGAGQTKVRGWLETWWYKFSYVRLKSFGINEIELFIRTFDHFVGKEFYSLRRTRFVFLCGLLSLVAGFLPQCARHYFQGDVIYAPGWNDELGVIDSVIAFSISLSLTRILAVFCGKFMVKLPDLNLALFVCLFVLQYWMFCLWTPVVTAATSLDTNISGLELMPIIAWVEHILFQSGFIRHKGHIIAYFPEIFSIRYQISRFYFSAIMQFYPDTHLVRFADQSSNSRSYYFPNYFCAEYILSLFPFLFRSLFAIMFLGSYLLLPFQESLLEIWGDIVESKKPVFFILLGGGAAVFQVVSNVFQLF